MRNAVQFRPWPPHFKPLSSNQEHRVLTNRTISEHRRYPAFACSGSGERQRVEGSFEDSLERAEIEDFRFHDLRHTFASWYMMNGDDLYELAKILGHSNIKMTERYAKLGRHHIAKTSGTITTGYRRNSAPSSASIGVSHLAALQLGSHRIQPLGIHHIRPCPSRRPRAPKLLQAIERLVYRQIRLK